MLGWGSNSQSAAKRGGAIWIGQCELSQGWEVTAVVPDDTPAAAFDHARVLVRHDHRPLGFVTTPMVNATVTADALRCEVTKLESKTGSRACVDTSRSATPPPPQSLAAAALPLTVAICTRDRPNQLARSLAAVQQVEYPKFEIVVVDNAPTDGATRELVRAAAATDGRIRYVVERRPGLSYARNRALSEAAFDIVAYTDDDVVADRFWLMGLASGFLVDDDVACVTGLVPAARLVTAAERYFDARVNWSDRMAPARYSLRRRPADDRLFPYHPGLFGTGANFAVDRKHLLAIGGFDVCLGAGSPTRGGEDLDAFVRVIRSSKTLVYEPAAIVWHFHRQQLDDLDAQVRDYGRGLAAVISKWLTTGDTSKEVLRRLLPAASHLFGMWRRSAIHSPDGPRLGASLVGAEAVGALSGVVGYLHARRALAREERGGS